MSAPNLTAHAGGAPTPVVSLKHDSPQQKHCTTRELKQLIAGLLRRHGVSPKNCSNLVFERGSAEINMTAVKRFSVVRWSR